MIRSLSSHQRKNFHLFVTVVFLAPVLLLSGPGRQNSFLVAAAESQSTPTATSNNNTPKKRTGWFSKLKMGNQVTRAMTYSIAKNERNAISVLEFHGKPLSWFRLDDGVMGGQSESSMTALIAEDGKLHFSGTINCNGGGFTSIRAKLPEGLLTKETTGLKIRYRGDGKTYKLLLSNGERGGPFSRVPSWQSDLPTTKKPDGDESWDEVTIPFDSLLPAFGGGPRSQPSEEDKKAYRFDPTEMKEVGLMLSLRLSDGSPNPVETFGEGIFPFSLVVASMATV